jgi:hypothetical protein
MRSWWWVLIAAAGWGVMMGAYITRARSDPSSPWAHSLLVVGPDLPDNPADIAQKTKLRLRLIPATEMAEGMIQGVSLVDTKLGLKLALKLRPKLFLWPTDGAKIEASALQSGRLPEAGRDEIIAGASAAHLDRLEVGDQTLKVVGVLKTGSDLLQNSYLLPSSERANALFGELEPSARAATLVQLTAQQLDDRKFLSKLQNDLPSATYTLLMPVDWLDSRTSYLYLAGMAAFLIGGAGSLIGLFRALANSALRSALARNVSQLFEPAETAESKPRPPWWAVPLLEMAERPRLVWGVHLAYFGLVILGSVIVSQFPEVQSILLTNVGEALGASSGPLAHAARAYATGNILYAAAVTFVINFFLGSLLVLTLPSVIIPGSGILMAILRSLVWGFLFAPTIGSLAYRMLPHSGTMLLEGEGYILAALFGLLIPIHIFQSSLGGTPLSRFGRVLWLNVLANFWVAVVLIVAACYEATEVIWMNS